MYVCESVSAHQAAGTIGLVHITSIDTNCDIKVNAPSKMARICSWIFGLKVLWKPQHLSFAQLDRQKVWDSRRWKIERERDEILTFGLSRIFWIFFAPDIILDAYRCGLSMAYSMENRTIEPGISAFWNQIYWSWVAQLYAYQCHRIS